MSEGKRRARTEKEKAADALGVAKRKTVRVRNRLGVLRNEVDKAERELQKLEANEKFYASHPALQDGQLPIEE